MIRPEVTMTIQFLEPLNRAWDRMKTALFRPFDLHKWFVFGFSAFLAGMMDASNGGGERPGREGGELRGVHPLPPGRPGTGS